MNKFVKTASAMFLTAALWSGVSYSHALMAHAAAATAVAITKQPSDYTGAAGDSVKFAVKANGSGLSYQWQLSDDEGKTWRNSSVKTAEYK